MASSPSTTTAAAAAASAMIRSTLRQSRPNKAGLRCPYVHTYVRVCVRTSIRPQKVFLDFSEIGMYVEVDE